MELPVVLNGQVPLGELLSRVMQAIYAGLSELAETLLNMSDTARKQAIADWIVKTKKQVMKLCAVMKWARNAETVQRCMNITAFLMDQNHQFENVIGGLTYARENLDPTRSHYAPIYIQVGSWCSVQRSIIPIPPMIDTKVIRTPSDMEEIMRYHLRMTETIHVKMSQHQIGTVT
ncbi:mediator complex, subunit Med14 [Chiua virens]|nr:mediator complex, subunit Med14 [Chiua virens]